MCSVLIVLFLYTICSVLTLLTNDVIVVILSQSNSFNLKTANELRENIRNQAADLSQNSPIVYLTNLDLPHVGAWTVIPLIPKLFKLHSDTSWFIFIEERTHIRIGKLLDVLSRHGHNQELWLGHSTYDREATIIHHFGFYEDPTSFQYPCTLSGFAISNALMKNLNSSIGEETLSSIDFSIDNGYELALLVWNKGQGSVLTDDKAFCLKKTESCATYPADINTKCEPNVQLNNLYFAVKTCKMFHKDRIPVVKNTWGKYARYIKYFSDEKDKTVPTTTLGVKNVKRGHCAKTMAIIKYVLQEVEKTAGIKWVLIVDDDTILSVFRLQVLLNCYNSSEFVALGERYGYDVVSGKGYNYLTGGSGMVFSSALIRELAKPGVCECPSEDTPDDMFLGMCLERLGVSITHSPQFHQARPVDYSPDVLESTVPVSFHKHWMIDPLKVYKDWFADDDANLIYASNAHFEL